ncbi:hypothetical protein A9Q84_00175 [Halobacteriovorax marinus]|uniref:Lipoprotein n=1 Tax=Halobacteriovorax marinus TaxID=97084 RepID=A0A1Y5FIV3_9BACT|nr:hypothetical protein A9Q84_00175 [Halobacteriovorax marinus]
MRHLIIVAFLLSLIFGCTNEVAKQSNVIILIDSTVSNKSDLIKLTRQTMHKAEDLITSDFMRYAGGSVKLSFINNNGANLPFDLIPIPKSLGRRKVNLKTMRDQLSISLKKIELILKKDKVYKESLILAGLFFYTESELDADIFLVSDLAIVNRHANFEKLKLMHPIPIDPISNRLHIVQVGIKGHTYKDREVINKWWRSSIVINSSTKL